MSSLLLVLLVVVWLFVLAPLVVKSRQPIRRTSDGLGRTRLLHQGGESVPTSRRRPTLTERDVRAPGEEVDETLETVDADLDEPILIDDVDDDADRVEPGTAEADAGADDVPAVVEGDVVYELEAAGTAGRAGSGGEGAATADARDDATADATRAGAAESTGDGVPAIAEPAGAADVTDAPSARRRAIADSAAEEMRARLAPEDFLVVDDVTAAGIPAPDATVRDDAADERDGDAVDDRADDIVDERDDDVLDERDDDIVAEHDDAEDDADDVDAALADDVLTDDDLAFAERRRGRGGFDPVSDARYAETRFARRRRSVAILAAAILVGVVVGLVAGGWTWWLPLAGTGLMVVYLVSLRRTVKAENELRARRIRRMKMARLGVRNSEDEELGIPERLRRPGAVVVELDDEDPDFADLPYATYRFPEEDIRPASGQ